MTNPLYQKLIEMNVNMTDGSIIIPIYAWPSAQLDLVTMKAKPIYRLYPANGDGNLRTNLPRKWKFVMMTEGWTFPDFTDAAGKQWPGLIFYPYIGPDIAAWRVTDNQVILENQCTWLGGEIRYTLIGQSPTGEQAVLDPGQSNDDGTPPPTGP